jgi:hypothetical protein
VAVIIGGSGLVALLFLAMRQGPVRSVVVPQGSLA